MISPLIYTQSPMNGGNVQVGVKKKGAIYSTISGGYCDATIVAAIDIALTIVASKGAFIRTRGRRDGDHPPR